MFTPQPRREGKKWVGGIEPTPGRVVETTLIYSGHRRVDTTDRHQQQQRFTNRHETTSQLKWPDRYTSGNPLGTWHKEVLLQQHPERDRSQIGPIGPRKERRGRCAWRQGRGRAGGGEGALERGHRRRRRRPRQRRRDARNVEACSAGGGS